MRILLLLLGCVLMCGANGAQAAAPPLFPDGVGSNLPFVELGKYAADPSSANWNDVQVTLVHYHEHVDEVRARLKAMRAQGQSKIALILWYVQDGDVCTSRAHYICPKQGRMPAQVERNIHDIIKDIAEAEFDTLEMRLAAQGETDPLGEKYDPARAKDSWALFETVHTICKSAIEGTKLHVLYDLGAETMGHPYSIRPGAQAFLKTMWTNYIAKYPPGETVGFTFNHAFEPATKQSLQVFASSGTWPAAIAVDLYDDPEKFLRNLSAALKSFGKGDYPIIVNETFRNNQEMAKAFGESRRTLGLNFRFLLQWPLTQGATGHSDSPLANEVDAYLK